MPTRAPLPAHSAGSRTLKSTSIGDKYFFVSAIARSSHARESCARSGANCTQIGAQNRWRDSRTRACLTADERAVTQWRCTARVKVTPSPHDEHVFSSAGAVVPRCRGRHRRPGSGPRMRSESVNAARAQSDTKATRADVTTYDWIVNGRR